MPTKRELLLSLRKGFEELELRDRACLNSLRDRGNMIIRRVFGPESSYSERLTRFGAGAPPAMVPPLRGRYAPFGSCN
jgi:hypothetical protein